MSVGFVTLIIIVGWPRKWVLRPNVINAKKVLCCLFGKWITATTSRTALGPTQPPIQWVLGALSLGVKRPRREADHSSPSSTEVKNAWSYTPTPPIRLHGVVLN
jgi:hypothetical protein